MGCVKRLDDLRERKLTRTIGKVFPCMLELKQKIIRGRGKNYFQNSIRLPREYLQIADGGIHNEALGSASRT